MVTPHFSQIIAAQALKYGDRAAFLHRRELTDEWTELGWNEFSEKVDALAHALYDMGVKEGDRVGQFSNNMVENMITDFALFSNRGVVVPMYATSTANQIEFIINDAGIEVLFVGDQVQFDIAMEVKARSSVLKTVVVFDPLTRISGEGVLWFEDVLAAGRSSSAGEGVEQRRQAATEDDLACILYTSGTTGNPKGVMLPHSCLDEAVRIHRIRIPEMTDQDTSIAFLPMSHVFERMWCYLCVANATIVYVNLRPIEVSETLKQVRPTMMCAVPRFWEKVYAAVQENIAAMPPSKQGIVTWALAVGKKYNIDTLRLGKKPGLGLSIKYKIADALIYSKVKKTVGIDNAKLFPVAGAKLSDDINIFLRSMGVPIAYGYGLTETTATVSFFEPVGYEFGTVGKIIPDLQVKIGPENEIMVKGRTVFSGYYKNPEANASAFTEDGFFRTGDAGFLRNGCIIITDRLKDLFKTSYGKYIAPQEIETRLSLDKYIEQVAVIGNEKPFVTAIIHPSIPALEAVAAKAKIKYSSVEEMLAHPQIYELMEKKILKQQEGMAPYELIKKFVMIPTPFSIQSGELTNTLKLKRPVVEQRYKLLIDEMYTR
ncbi:MAG: long-chain fatty acid--CoA ligase [Paludibacter sp.]|nr:long-chain fatty acid--CoA ligase [Paludibacter sp.]